MANPRNSAREIAVKLLQFNKDILVQLNVVDYFKSNNKFAEFVNDETTLLENWLQFHSYIKSQLAAEIDKYHKNSISLFDSFNRVIDKFLLEEKIKNNLPKLSVNDFDFEEKNDYFSFAKQLYQFNYKISDTDPLQANSLKPLVNAKNRRAKVLGRNFNGICISNKDFASRDDGLYTDYKEIPSMVDLVDAILSLKEGDRQQIFYYHLHSNHVNNFDIERTKDGFRIFSFESANDINQLQVLDLLYKALQDKNIQFELRAARTLLQADGYNCALYGLSVMNEFAKYDHVFEYDHSKSTDYLDYTAIQKNDQIIYDKRRKKTNQVKTQPDEPRYTPDSNRMSHVKWVKLASLPEKIISMSQSYTSMKEDLHQ